MSGKQAEEADENNVCANCGVAEVDDIKLMDCDGCDLAKCCSDKCQENHREQHEEECKTRKAELRDKELFEQPEESHLGECPICFLPLPLDTRKSTFHSCCCKIMCDGCEYADLISNGGDRCPFCRELAVNGEEEHDKRVMERVKVNDPNALRKMGWECYQEGDYDKAFEYWKQAAELGNAVAHNNLGGMHYYGQSVVKNEENGISHFEKAAIGGHPTARHNLAAIEEKNGNIDRAVKHLIIAANLGLEDSMKMLWKHYSFGYITKEELESTLRTHKAAIDAAKSPQREAAEVWRESQRGA